MSTDMLPQVLYNKRSIGNLQNRRGGNGYTIQLGLYPE